MCQGCYLRIKVGTSLKKCECSPECKDMIYESDIHGNAQRYSNGHHFKLIKRPDQNGSGNYNWRGGRYFINGYWILHLPNYPYSDKNGNVPEHVYFYQQYHKCCMLPWGVVHHIIPVKEGGSNMPWNLQGMTRSKHMKLHNPKKDMSDRICIICISNQSHGNWYIYNDKFMCKLCYMKKYKKRLLLSKNTGF